jgi:threonine 3-dehydrogenase
VNALKIARENDCRIFIPSTIGVFGGDNFQKIDTPVDSILQPKTVYGVGKVFNEMIGEYFANKYEMDFRCLRYPGVISSEKYAFNGTTDYSTEIFFHLLEKGHYDCFLKEDAQLPMMYIDDCISATV